MMWQGGFVLGSCYPCVVFGCLFEIRAFYGLFLGLLVSHKSEVVVGFGVFFGLLLYVA